MEIINLSGISEVDNAIIKAHQARSGSSQDTNTVYAHAGIQLLEIERLRDTGKKDSHGESVYEWRILDLYGLVPKSRITNPENFTVLWKYVDWYEKAFCRVGKSVIHDIPYLYAVSMIGKEGQARNEYVMIGTASAMNTIQTEVQNNAKKLGQS